MNRIKFHKFLFLALTMFIMATSVFGQASRDDKAKKGKEDKTVTHDVKAWKLVNDFSAVQNVVVDSSMFNFHQYNPIYRNSISNTHLGYIGAPYQNNYFFKRNTNVDFYFLRTQEQYTINPEKVTYYNTHTPFSFLKYSQSMQSQVAKEQTFQAFFTQNIDSSANVGINFSTIKDAGPYNLQEALHNHFSVFGSKNSERYNGYFFFSTGGNSVTENGGITTETINPRFNIEDIAVNLPTGLQNSIRNLTLFTKQEYFLGRNDSIMLPDSSMAAEFTPILSIAYNAEFKNYSRIMKETSVNTGYFDHSYLRTGSFEDTLWFRHFEHAIQIKALESKNRKFTFGKRVFAKNEIVMATHPLLDGVRKYNYSNVSVGGELYQSKSRFFQWSANTEITLLGRNIGDAVLKGNLRIPIHILGDTIALNGSGWYADKSADIYQEHLLQNHVQYENNFRKQHEVVVKGNVKYDRYKLSAGVDYALLSNYLYNNSQGLPDQYEAEFSVFGIWARKNFEFGRFGSQLKADWQEVSNSAALHLPNISAYANIYYHHYLFKVMEIQLGAEVFYHTKFYADSYDVSTNQFYYQNEHLIGGFPNVNVFCKCKA